MARSPFGFAPWPAVPDDEATPVGLAPGQMPVDPRRDGSRQPTAADAALSRAIGDGIARGFTETIARADALGMPATVSIGVAERGTDGFRLAHHAATERVGKGIVEDAIDGGAGECGHRIHRHVAPELVPDVLLDAR